MLQTVPEPLKEVLKRLSVKAILACFGFCDA